jgi:rhodanese-related sulfurtransferase
MKNNILILLISVLITLQGCDYFFPPLKGEQIPPGEAYSFLKKHKDDPDVVLIDLRTKEEYEISHIAGAINMDFSLTTFPGDVEKLNKDKRYFVYSTNDRNSLLTLELLRENRIEKRHMISGGFNEWVRQGFPPNLN